MFTSISSFVPAVSKFDQLKLISWKDFDPPSNFFFRQISGDDSKSGNMKVKIRTVDGTVKTLDVSKAMLVQDFRKKVFEATGIEPKKQRLLFRGKQMENGCDLLDYRVEIGTIIDVTERVVLEEVDANTKAKKEGKEKKEDPPKFSEEREPGESTFCFKVISRAVG